MEENKPFIKEKIKQKTSAGKTFRRIITVAACAIIFGVVAAIVLSMSAPIAEKVFGEKEETTTQQVVLIPRDELPVATVEETMPMLTIADAGNESAEIPTRDAAPEVIEPTEAVEEIINEAIAGYKYSIDDLNSMWRTVAILCNNLESSIVEVKTSEVEDEWPQEEENEQFSGVVIAENDSNLYVLTLAEAAESDNINVNFSNNYVSGIKSKNADNISGLAVLTVAKEALNEESLKLAKPVELGNSYTVGRGDMLIELGSPKGITHSSAYTWASYISIDNSISDGSTRIIYTDNVCDTQKGSWIFNTSGELVGWAGNRFGERENSTPVICLSDFKGVLERLINGGYNAYIGLVPVNVTQQMKDKGMPQGIYIKEVEPGSPAYERGIQPGDVLYKINNMDINSIVDYKDALDRLNAGMEVAMQVKRMGADEYKDIEFKVLVDKR